MLQEDSRVLRDCLQRKVSQLAVAEAEVRTPEIILTLNSALLAELLVRMKAPIPITKPLIQDFLEHDAVNPRSKALSHEYWGRYCDLKQA